MRVKDYLTIVIAVCLVSAFAIEAFLSAQFDQARRHMIEQSQSERLASEFSYIENNLAQFLLSADLIIGSGETYLIPGSLEQGSVLVEQLETFRNHAQFPSQDAGLALLAETVFGVCGLIESAAQISAADRDAKLASLLARFDPFATQIDAETERVNAGIAQQVVASAGQFESAAQYRQMGRIVALLVFLAIVLTTWRWSSRQISRPIGRLADMANESTAKNNFVGVTSGPREVRNLSERFKSLTQRLVHQATHDPLTNLVNRRELERLLETWLTENAAQADSDDILGVICYIDLDRFKLVNDTCGHSAGDDLLNQVAEIFRGTTRFGDIIARLGGDEFCIVLKSCGLNKGLDIAELLRRRIEELKFEFRDQVFRISASIGVAKVSSGSQSSESIIDQADSACAVAKESGRNRIYVFDLLDRKVDQKRLDTVWVNELTLALEEQRLVLFRQPIVPLSATNGQGRRFEILVRMRGTDGKIIPPSRFLPVAERYNLSTRIDKWVIKATLQWLAAAPGELGHTATCSINLSGESLARPQFLEFVRKEIRRSAVPGKKLCFEITETRAIEDIDAARRFIRSLRELGCQFALDDFGTGHSSFSYLRDLPVDYVKIDGTFVRNILENSVDEATVLSLVDVSRACGKKTVAEYVESQAILERLREMNVDFAQGYHCGVPAQIDAIFEMEFSNVVHF
ncbi:MAG: EAL domain-containing protein [Pseudomonadota bacterium]